MNVSHQNSKNKFCTTISDSDFFCSANVSIDILIIIPHQMFCKWTEVQWKVLLLNVKFLFTKNTNGGSCVMHGVVYHTCIAVSSLGKHFTGRYIKKTDFITNSAECKLKMNRSCNLHQESISNKSKIYSDIPLRSKLKPFPCPTHFL